ncbi:D-alanine--D-alanine ligase [Idiomarina fontislapidosi]|uniref:D-alanine--D-alanine ligase n=1 Tax=Idiomarina fontislapidosi TaxID=263723 RepID=A0A432Y2E4_9GAMM|nr:D-alanine--D-alanine ligase [Idiomarina fontislapidosi]PYE33281.1 D-alanine--D-alanine ligase [Idiomarina fontislapidosi]RUO55118.1 D-alanine--D-alanine ligase [Idiomarina fontislapidosi]
MKPSAFGKVAVLMGGTSAERDVSLKSGKAVLNALCAQQIDAFAFDPAERPLTDLLELGVERAFIVLHGRGGEDGAMQGALQTLGVPYTGSSVLGCALAMDKVRTKQIWQSMHLPVAPSVVIRVGTEHWDAEQILLQLGAKVIVKPALEGSSIGMSVADNASELDAAIKEALGYNSDVLVERWITGKEYTVALLNDEALPAIRLQTPHQFYDFSAKYQANDTQYHCPAGLSDADEDYLRQLALAAFAALDGRGWGRIDAMRDEQGQWFLLEANAVPGMTEKSLVPMAAKQSGLSFEQLVWTILAQTLEQ